MGNGHFVAPLWRRVTMPTTALKVLKEYSLAHAPYCFPPSPLGEERMSLKMVWWTEAVRKQVLFLYLFAPSPLLPRHFLKGQGQEQVF
jgi:hypothetical protein